MTEKLLTGTLSLNTTNQPSTTGIFSSKGYKHFNQTEMLTSKVQLGYILTRGGGQAVQGGLSCPPPKISQRKDNQQFLLHHLLQKYLVERNINFISVNKNDDTV